MVQSPNYEVETIEEAQRLYDKIVWTEDYSSSTEQLTEKTLAERVKVTRRLFLRQ